MVAVHLGRGAYRCRLDIPLRPTCPLGYPPFQLSLLLRGVHDTFKLTGSHICKDAFSTLFAGYVGSMWMAFAVRVHACGVEFVIQTTTCLHASIYVCVHACLQASWHVWHICSASPPLACQDY